MNFNNDNLDQIRKELNDVLARYGASNSIDFKIGKMTYNTDSFSLKLEAFNTDAGGTAEQMSFEQGCARFGIPREWYGKSIDINGIDYIISGVNTRARKYPISLRNSNTGNVDKKCSVDMVSASLIKRKLSGERNVTPITPLLGNQITFS